MKLSTLFTDHAVFQRGKSIPVWGEASPLQLIEAEIAGVSARGVSGADGRFLLRLPSIPEGGPYTLTVREIPGGATVCIRDIVTGEVFLASGQSNMEFRLRETPEQQQEFNAENSSPGDLRLFHVRRHDFGDEAVNADGQWNFSTPENTADFSAVALFCGRELQKQLKVPVGIIDSSWGGTRIAAWTSRETLASSPLTAAELEEYERALPAAANFSQPGFCDDHGDETICDNDEYLTLLGRRDPGIRCPEYAAPDFDDSAWQRMPVPGSWIDEKIAGNGVVWVRRKAEIPPEWVGKDLVLHLGAIDKQDITFVNGVEVGRTGSGLQMEYFDLPRSYPVPASLVVSTTLQIAIRAFSFVYDGAFTGTAADYSLTLAGEKSAEHINLAGTFFAKCEVDFGRVARKGLPDYGPRNPNTMHILFDGMIRPLIPYALGGILWYQGEQDTATVADARDYRQRMQELIRDWRFHWGQGTIPFFMVQIANYTEVREYDAVSTWAVLRDSQRRVCDDAARTYMAVSADTGEIANIHPKDKKTVGKRLAAAVLNDRGMSPEGVLKIAHAVRSGSTVQITVAGVTGNLFLKRGTKGFMAAVWEKNQGRAPEQYEYESIDAVSVSGNRITLFCSAGTPLAIRYAWSNNSPLTVYDEAEYPLSPFEIEL